MNNFDKDHATLADALGKVPGVEDAWVNYDHVTGRVSVSIKGVFRADPERIVNQHLGSVGLPQVVFGGIVRMHASHEVDGPIYADFEKVIEPWHAP